MSILGKLHDAVFEENPQQSTPPSVEQPQHSQHPQKTTGIPGIPGISIPAQPSASVPSILPSTVQGTADANLTATFVGKLREKFTAAASAGVLSQFTSTLEALTEDTPEEGKRFRMAVKVTKLTPDQLTEAYNSLLDVLETETSKFKTSVDHQKVTEVDKRDQQVQQINAQIEDLNKQIESLSSQRDGILTDIVAAKTHLAAATVSFEGAVSSLQAEVNDSLQKLRIYLPAAIASTAKK